MDLHIERFICGPLNNNVYLVWEAATGQAVVIDPGIQSEAARRRMTELTRQGIRLQAIWNTHAHFDHIYDNASWQSGFAVPILMHQSELFWLDRLQDMARWLGQEPPELFQPDLVLQGDTVLHLGDIEVLAWHTPGHSPGELCFIIPAHHACFSGDVLFRGSVGRTDLPGCSPGELQHSLARLMTLPDGTRVWPGHGEPTTVGEEKSANPFLS